jgi:hypothetical protein
MMRRLYYVGALVCTGALVLCSTVSVGAAVAIGPGPLKVLESDVIVIGKVANIEDHAVEMPVTPSSKVKGAHRIAVLKVAEVLKGELKDSKTVLVAFRAPKPNRLMLSAGKDGLFYLTRSNQGDYLLLTAGNQFVSKRKKAIYDPELAQVRLSLKILRNPLASLKSTDADERQVCAFLLISQYRKSPSGPVQTQPISAEESRLIFKALLEANWNFNQKGYDYKTGPVSLFNQLGVTERDGYHRPADAREIPDAIKAWLKMNWQTYRIQRFVPAAGAGAPRPVSFSILVFQDGFLISFLIWDGKLLAW